MAIIYENNKYYDTTGGKKREISQTDPNYNNYIGASGIPKDVYNSQAVQNPVGASGIPNSVYNPNQTYQQTTQPGGSGITDPRYNPVTGGASTIQPMGTPPPSVYNSQDPRNPANYNSAIGSSGITDPRYNPATGGRVEIGTPPPGVYDSQDPRNPSAYNGMGGGTDPGTGPGTDPGYNPPGTTDPSAQYDPQWQQIIDWFDSLKNPSPNQGLQEDYSGATSPSAINQALTNLLMGDINNANYGYTDAEKAMILENAMNDFNMNTDQDVRTLENMAEQYGWNSGVGEMGGQGKSSFEDYYGKRAQAQRGLLGDLSEQFLAEVSKDKQNTISNAMNLSNAIADQDHVATQDALSLLQFDSNDEAQSFNQTLESAGFISEDQQRRAMIDLGYSQLDIDTYFKTKEMTYNQDLQTAQYLQDTFGLSPDQALQALSYANSNEANILSSSIGMDESAMLPLIAMSMLLGGNGTGTGTGTGDPGLDLPSFDVGDFKFDMGWDDIGKLVGGLFDLANPLTWGKMGLKLLSNLGGKGEMNAGATFRWNGKEYTIGADGAPKLDTGTGGPPTTPETPGFVQNIGNLIAAYGMYKVATGFMKSRGMDDGKIDRLEGNEMAHASYDALKNNNVQQMLNVTTTQTGFDKLLMFTALKEGMLDNPKSTGATDQKLPAISLDEGEMTMLKAKGYDWLWDYASTENVEKILEGFPTQESSSDDWLKFMTDSRKNGYWQYDRKTTKYDTDYWYYPPLTDKEYMKYLDTWVESDFITSQQRDAEIATMKKYKDVNDSKKW
jgi:hypothetical protein